jgi:hypothetical protein
MDWKNMVPAPALRMTRDIKRMPSALAQAQASDSSCNILCLSLTMDEKGVVRGGTLVPSTATLSG